jgi:glycerol 2-dehydrogenase (NADP+)
MNPAGNPPTFPLLPDGTRDVHDVPFAETWTAMEKLLDTGKVRAIGVANFDITNLEILRKECKIVPAVNQVELHPYLQQKKLKEYCAANGIHVTAYSP